MAKRNIIKNLKEEEASQLYIAIDHLKKGAYQLNIIDKNNIVTVIKFRK